jgi:hypothetical protein
MAWHDMTIPTLHEYWQGFMIKNSCIGELFIPK